MFSAGLQRRLTISKLKASFVDTPPGIFRAYPAEIGNAQLHAQQIQVLIPTQEGLKVPLKGIGWARDVRYDRFLVNIRFE